MEPTPSSKEEKLAQILEGLVSQNYELRAQNCALREALATFASSVLRRPFDDMLNALEESEKYWHQWILERLEDHSPSSAASIDKRSYQQIWTVSQDDQPPTIPS